MRLVSLEVRATSKRNKYTAVFGPWILLVTFVAVVAVLFYSISIHGTGGTPGLDGSSFYCDLAGKIRYNPYGYNRPPNNYFDTPVYDSPLWDASLFLSVTIGFQGLSFAEAKAIDISFDLIVGRGSQVIAALAVDPTVRRAILRSMEIKEFPLAVLLPFFLEKFSVSTLWAIIASATTAIRMKRSDNDKNKSRGRTDWRFILVFFIGSYILALPTLFSAMTSYQAGSKPFVPIAGDATYVTTDNLTLPDFVIADGERVGLESGFPVYNSRNPELYDACYGCKNCVIFLLPYRVARLTIFTDWSTISPSGSPLTNIYSLWRQDWKPLYQEYSSGDVTAAFDKTQGSLPFMQNIASSDFPPSWSFTVWPHNVTSYDKLHLVGNVTSSTILIQGVLNKLDQNPLRLYHNNDLNVVPGSNITLNRVMNQLATYYAYGNTSFELNEVTARGICLPTNEYVWGFSSLMLFTFCMLTIVIATMLMVLHYDAFCNSAADRYRLYVSPYRDVLDLADEMRTHYGSTEVASMSAQALDKAMRQNPATVGLETASLNAPRLSQKKWTYGRQWLPIWRGRRSRTQMAGSQEVDPEESLMTIGLDTRTHGMETGKLPATALSRSSTRS
jgi:hypothetical protein